MKIVVLIKRVPDTWDERKFDTAVGRVDRSASEGVVDEVGERAIEAALTYKDDNDAEVVLVTMGPAESTDILRKGLAMGADSALHVVDDELVGADMALTARVLAAAVRQAGFDLVICGNQSTDGAAGVVPAMLAEHLQVPSATELDSVSIAADGISGQREAEEGLMEVSASLPAVVSMSERAPEPRYPNFRGIMRARKKPLSTLSCADLGVDSPLAASVVVKSSERPAREAGTKVVDDGNAASQLADFLATANLI